MSETTFLVPIKKIDEDQRLVFGWASVVEDEHGNSVVDSQGDVIPVAELEQAAYEFVLRYRQAGEMHERAGSDVGDLVESVVLTKAKREAMGLPPGPTGWFVGFKLAPDVFAKVKSGEYQDFSIGGACVARDEINPGGAAGG
jgi:hypothetical protein